MYIPRFRNVVSARRNSCAATATRVYSGRGSWTRGVDSADFGADFRRKSRGPAEWSIYIEIRRDAAVPRQSHLAVGRQTRPLGHAASQHLGDLSRQRGARWRSR
jgi:hypothetical protein